MSIPNIGEFVEVLEEGLDEHYDFFSLFTKRDPAFFGSDSSVLINVLDVVMEIIADRIDKDDEGEETMALIALTAFIGWSHMKGYSFE